MKKLSCDFCSKVFKSQNNLYLHNLAVHTVENIPCHECEKCIEIIIKRDYNQFSFVFSDNSFVNEKEQIFVLNFCLGNSIAKMSLQTKPVKFYPCV